MTPLDCLRDIAIAEGRHNYAQWIEEHADAAFAASTGFDAGDLVIAHARIFALETELDDARAENAELQQQIANQTAPADWAPAGEPAPAGAFAPTSVGAPIRSRQKKERLNG